MPGHILHVCYSPTSLLIVEEPLIALGYEVVTVLGLDGVQTQPHLSEYDLVVLGEGSPLAERQETIRWFRAESPSTHVLALCRPGEELPEADHQITMADGKAWLDLVAHSLRPR